MRVWWHCQSGLRASRQASGDQGQWQVTLSQISHLMSLTKAGNPLQGKNPVVLEMRQSPSRSHTRKSVLEISHKGGKVLQVPESGMWHWLLSPRQFGLHCVLQQTNCCLRQLLAKLALNYLSFQLSQNTGWRLFLRMSCQWKPFLTINFFFKSDLTAIIFHSTGINTLVCFSSYLKYIFNIVSAIVQT